MVNALTALRQEVAQTLSNTGLEAYTYLPARLALPVALVVPSDTYVSLPTGQTFGERYAVNLQVVIMSNSRVNEETAEEIDTLIVGVMDALEDWDITQVSNPGDATVNGNPVALTVINVTTNSNLEEVI